MKLRAAVALAGLSLIFAGLIPAAQAATGASCGASSGVTLKPGISMKPSGGTFASSSGGAIACVGVFKGTAVAGKGSLSFTGSYGPGDTCAKGKGSGKLSATLHKAAGGTLRAFGSFSFTRAGSDVIVTGKLGGARLSGNLQFLPKPSQNCFKTKVTSATVSGAALSLG